MNKIRFPPFLACVGVLLAQTGGNAPQPSYKVPDGFVVETVATPEETGSLINLTFDSAGRLVVSRERSGPALLLDNDGDGRYETQKLLTEQVKYNQGLWFDGRTLYTVGHGPDGAGLYRLEDKDGDDAYETIETLIRFTGPMGEHGPHAIKRGPDGHLYLLVGNHTGIAPGDLDGSSPYRNYREDQLLPTLPDARGHARDIRAPGSVIYRLDLARKRYSAFCAGFRNPYDFAFNLDGEVFTFDSDMEWDIGMPWYREVRSVHCVPGGEYGWRTGSGKWPNHAVDSLPPLREVGRGSPVGVETYQHYAYPKRFWDAYLEGDWSRGRILMASLMPAGATYRVGDLSGDFVYGEPLNVTDLEVGPDGNVYFVNGGRDTAGGVFRVVYKGTEANRRPGARGVEAALYQPQPLSSWGHAALLKIKEQSGEAWATELQRICLDAARPAPERARALGLLERLGPRPRATLLKPMSEDPDAVVRSAAVYVLGQHRSDAARALVIARLKDTAPVVRRRALEALVWMGMEDFRKDFAPAADVATLLNDADRFVRFAARLALERMPRATWENIVLREQNPLGAIEGLVALARISKVSWEFNRLFDRELELFGTTLSPDDTLRLLRAFALTAARSEGGPSPAFREKLGEMLISRFPTGSRWLDREYASVLAYLQPAGAIARVLAALEKETQREQQLHYVYAVRHFKSGWTPAQRRQMIGWFEQAQKWRGGASFPGFVEFMFNSVLEVMTAEEKKLAWAKCPDFAPATEAQGRNVNALAVFQRRKGTQALSPQELSEYLLYDPMILRGNPERGKKAYEKAQCHMCHKFGEIGQGYGPDLTTIGSRFSRKDLIEALIYPSKTVSDLYAAVEIVTTDGKKLIGPVISEDESQVTLAVMGMARQSIPRKNIRSRNPARESVMPEGLLDDLTTAEAADLLALLQSAREK